MKSATPTAWAGEVPVKIPAFMLSTLFVAIAASAHSESSADIQRALVISDAENFAELFEKSGGKPAPEQLQTKYLDSGSDGIRIFTPVGLTPNRVLY